jgi:hypothetical protein
VIDATRQFFGNVEPLTRRRAAHADRFPRRRPCGRRPFSTRSDAVQFIARRPCRAFHPVPAMIASAPPAVRTGRPKPRSSIDQIDGTSSCWPTEACDKFRAGRTDKALAELAKEAALVNADPIDDLLAAIAHARTGQVAEAKARIAKALTAFAAEDGQPMPRQRKAALDVLRTDAQCALLDCAFSADP